MYRTTPPKKTKTSKKKKIGRFLNEMFEGRHLVRAWRQRQHPIAWWTLLLVTVILISIFNERKIEQKKQQVLELQQEKEKVMHELKSMNEVLYSEEEEALRQQAAQLGFQNANANEFFKIGKKQDITKE